MKYLRDLGVYEKGDEMEAASIENESLDIEGKPPSEHIPLDARL